MRYSDFCKKFPIQTHGQQYFSVNFLGKITKNISLPRFLKLGTSNSLYEYDECLNQKILNVKTNDQNSKKNPLYWKSLFPINFCNLSFEK